MITATNILQEDIAQMGKREEAWQRKVNILYYCNDNNSTRLIFFRSQSYFKETNKNQYLSEIITYGTTYTLLLETGVKQTTGHRIPVFTDKYNQSESTSRYMQTRLRTRTNVKISFSEAEKKKRS